MSLRPPRLISIRNGSDSGFSGFEREVANEKAIALGIAGAKVSRALAALNSAVGPDERETALNAAAEAVQYFLIQREACGLRDPRGVVEDYDIPRQVMARLGAGRKLRDPRASSRRVRLSARHGDGPEPSPAPPRARTAEARFPDLPTRGDR